MLSFIKKYWAELLTFGVMFGALLICCIPDITWINTDCDGPHYIYSAKWLYPAHKTSAPLFLLLGHLFTWIKLPGTTYAWQFAMLSVIASTISSIFIYLIIKQKTNNKWFGIIGSLIFGSSALVISQSIIVESYALVTMFGILAYYFIERKQYVWTAIMLGAGGAVHHLIGIPIIVFLILYKDFRKWKYIGIMSIFLLFYLYIPITNRPPYMWQSPNGELSSSFLIDNFSTLLMLFGGLSIWDLPKRILDTLGIFGVSLGLGGLLLLWKILTTNIKKTIKEPLFWLFILPFIYYATDLAPQTYVYVMPGIAFGTIIIGTYLSEIGNKYAGKIFITNKTKVIASVIGISCLVMLGYNTNYFDVGRTLDKNLSAREFYNYELSKIPDGNILLAQQGWEWAMVYPYNKNEGKDIIPICTGTLASQQYQDLIKSWGVKFDTPKEKVTLVELQNYIIKSIVENNKNVWTTFPTNAKTYGAEVVPLFVYNAPPGTQENEWTQYIYEPYYERLINDLSTPQGITDGSQDMIWKWKPSNPYDIITGAIEVEEWIYIIFSNYTILTFTMMAFIGAVPCWILYMFIIKKKKWSIKKAKEVIKNEI